MWSKSIQRAAPASSEAPPPLRKRLQENAMIKQELKNSYQEDLLNV